MKGIGGDNVVKSPSVGERSKLSAATIVTSRASVAVVVITVDGFILAHMQSMVLVMDLGGHT
jgi:hypothetical protein